MNHKNDEKKTYNKTLYNDILKKLKKIPSFCMKVSFIGDIK